MRITDWNVELCTNSINKVKLQIGKRG